MVSFISKIIPSPDWFIGLDSLDLCKNGSWSSSVEMEVDLLDGGTDNGFTFTSPNYPTLPPSPVEKITNILPDHPAGEGNIVSRAGILINAHKPFLLRLDGISQTSLGFFWEDF